MLCDEFRYTTTVDTQNVGLLACTMQRVANVCHLSVLGGPLSRRMDVESAPFETHARNCPGVSFPSH